MSSSCSSSLFGPSAQYIKVLGGEFVAVEGANILERLNVGDLRMPYKQILKSRIILKTDQENYLLNHLGLGDNATFLAIKAVYNPKSVIEEDNYIYWSFYDDLARINSMSQMMVLTGNSSNRVKQLYLTNPSKKYPVMLDVMVGIIDDNYSFFQDSNQSGTSFTNLESMDIMSHVVGESIKIMDKGIVRRALIYIKISDIESIQRSGSILIIDDSSYGVIFLQFIDAFNAIQAHSLLSYIIENPDIDTNELDELPPVITFKEVVGSEPIMLNNVYDPASAPYKTSDGDNFSTSIILMDHINGYGKIDREKLIVLLVDSIVDNIDGVMVLQPANIVLFNTLSIDNTILFISEVGEYLIKFNFSDIGRNSIDFVEFKLNVI